jgi:hypothetical protein
MRTPRLNRLLTMGHMISENKKRALLGVVLQGYPVPMSDEDEELTPLEVLVLLGIVDGATTLEDLQFKLDETPSAPEASKRGH